MATDERIKKEIIDQLYWDTRVDASDIKVEVSDRNVVLAGTVPSYGTRQAAETDAFIIQGVVSVRNDLQVKFTPEVTIPTDEALVSNIETLLEWHPDIESTDIMVSADNGNVTLEGSVKTYWEKIGAEDLVATLSGVVGITNLLAVVPSETVDDQIIADDIITALDRNAMIDAGDIDVKAENGVVTFTGTVPSAAAYRAATTIGWYTRGVCDVRNNLVIV